MKINTTVKRLHNNCLELLLYHELAPAHALPIVLLPKAVRLDEPPAQTLAQLQAAILGLASLRAFKYCLIVSLRRSLNAAWRIF